MAVDAMLWGDNKNPWSLRNNKKVKNDKYYIKNNVYIYIYIIQNGDDKGCLVQKIFILIIEGYRKYFLNNYYWELSKRSMKGVSFV